MAEVWTSESILGSNDPGAKRRELHASEVSEMATGLFSDCRPVRKMRPSSMTRLLVAFIGLVTGVVLLPIVSAAAPAPPSLASGTVVAWGWANGPASVPAGLSGVTAIAAGFFHSLALTSDGTVVAWAPSPRDSITARQACRPD